MRTRPKSLYFKFHAPNKGREAIYVAGRHNDKVVAHDVGLGRLLAGTMNLDPKGAMAMEANRHPVTEAGIGVLIHNIAHYWALELTPEESLVTINPDMTIGPRRCTMIESVHPERSDRFLYHKVRVYIDRELGLPIRFEVRRLAQTPRRGARACRGIFVPRPQAQRRAVRARFRSQQQSVLLRTVLRRDGIFGSSPSILTTARSMVDNPSSRRAARTRNRVACPGGDHKAREATLAGKRLLARIRLVPGVTPVTRPRWPGGSDRGD